MLIREKYLSKIRDFYDITSLIKIIYGMRRSGKSVILTQIMDEIKNKGVNEKNIIDLFGKVIEQNSQNMISLIQEYKSGDDNDIYINSTYRCNSRYAYNYNF